MRFSRTVLFSALIISSARLALADPIEIQELLGGKEVSFLVRGLPANVQLDDPQIRIRRLRRGSVPFSGLTFSFDSETGTGMFDFFNASNRILYSLTFTFTPGGPASDVPTLFSCGVESELSVLPFRNCHFKQAGDAGSPTVVTFSGPPGLPGRSHFAVDIAGFQPGTQVHAAADPVPEPGTIILSLTGFGLLLGGRLSGRFRRSMRNS